VKTGFERDPEQKYKIKEVSVLSVREIPHGLKLGPGSAVKVVTIVADQEKHRGHKKYKDDNKDSKDYKEHKDKDECKDHKDHKDKDTKDHKEHKEHNDHVEFGDAEGIFTGVVLDETDIDLNRDAGKYHQAKEDEKKKDKPPLTVKEEERFLVLSLLKPSPPFSAGQIVWINVQQIVALTIINSK